MKATTAYRESGDSVGGIGTGNVTLGDQTTTAPYVSFAYDGLWRRTTKSIRLGGAPARLFRPGPPDHPSREPSHAWGLVSQIVSGHPLDRFL